MNFNSLDRLAKVKSFHTTCLFLLILSVFVIPVRSQDILTNAAVIEMVKTGLSQEIVIAKIRSSSVSFDTSTQALKILSDSGVPESVVVAMITEAGKASKANAAEEKADNKVMSGVPEQGRLRDILSKTKIYLLTEDLKSRDIIEKELRKIKKFVLVDKVEDCDFAIKYESWTETVNVSATVIGSTATARENKQLIGVFTVMMPSDDPKLGRVRLIYSARKAKYFIWEDNPAESTTKQFIKDLTKAASIPGEKH